MGASITASRVKTIYIRQNNPSWDESYVPSILATRSEAPSVSKPAKIYSSKFKRRIHCLSNPELNFALLALYHPNIVGIQEQRMLPPLKSEHPLSGFPGVDKVRLAPMMGTLEVAKELGCENLIRKVLVTNNQGERVALAVPFIGDHLLAIKSGSQISCINWSIKSNQSEFRVKELYQFNVFNRSKAKRESQYLRHLIEQVQYESCGITTHALSEDQFDRNVFDNLRQIYVHCQSSSVLSTSKQQELLDYFKAAFKQGTPPSEIIGYFDLLNKFTPEQSKQIFYKAIWNRALRVDLFRPVLIDRPLRPEKVDVLEHYAEYFEGQQ